MFEIASKTSCQLVRRCEYRYSSFHQWRYHVSQIRRLFVNYPFDFFLPPYSTIHRFFFSSLSDSLAFRFLLFPTCSSFFFYHPFLSFSLFFCASSKLAGLMEHRGTAVIWSTYGSLNKVSPRPRRSFMRLAPTGSAGVSGVRGKSGNGDGLCESICYAALNNLRTGRAGYRHLRLSKLDWLLHTDFLPQIPSGFF